MEWLAVLILGLVAGIMSGLFGIGGGVIIVANFDCRFWFYHN